MIRRLVPESRTWRAVALGMAFLAALVAPGLAPADAQEHPPGHGDGLVPPGDWSHAQVEEMLDLIDRTEELLPAFSDPDELIEMGFYDFGITAPGGYDHYINWEWLDDEYILDPAHPESLVFHTTWNDTTQEPEYELVSAMFFLPTSYDMTNMPEDVAWFPGWHTHADVCINDQHRFSGLADGAGNCSSGVPFDKPPMMHVWITDNECGHRFGGIDVGGLHCDAHGGPHDPDPHDPDPHDPDPHDPDPHDPDPHDPDPHDPGPHDPGPHDPGPQDPGPHDPGHHDGPDPTVPGHDHDDDTPPGADPIHRHPTFAG